jgi:hypothetical protein
MARASKAIADANAPRRRAAAAMRSKPIMGAVVEIRQSEHGYRDAEGETPRVHPVAERRAVATVPARPLHCTLPGFLIPIRSRDGPGGKHRPPLNFSGSCRSATDRAAGSRYIRQSWIRRKQIKGEFHAAPIYRNHFARCHCKSRRKCRVGGRGRLDGLVVRNQRWRWHRQLVADRFGITLRGVRHLLPQASCRGETADPAVKRVLPSPL